MAYLIVFLGAGIGGSLRHFVNVLAMRLGEPTYVGTAFINITGSLLIGLVVEYFALKSHLPRRWLLFITTGIMGGYDVLDLLAGNGAAGGTQPVPDGLRLR